MSTNVDPLNFLKILKNEGINFYTGVPDSLLKEFNACILNNIKETEHVIASNEGSAIGIGIGHYLSNKSPALIYMQNSGLGNSINPLVSLADPTVMSCPMLLLIGWRGEILNNGSQLLDEPQHIKQGSITLEMLRTIGIPYYVIDKDNNLSADIKNAIKKTKSSNCPVAIVIRKNFFSKSKYKSKDNQNDLLNREKVIEIIISNIPKNYPIICTTGMASRELFELRKRSKSFFDKDLLCVGGMGHAISIATGVALRRKNKVVCIDGDGSMLMHLGALTNSSKCSNLIHVVLNNGAHDSVGGQPTRAKELDLSKIAKSCGYMTSKRAKNTNEIKLNLSSIIKAKNSSFLEVLCKKGNRADLGRPSKTPKENKDNFINFLKKND